jgi:hypothetical protein
MFETGSIRTPLCAYVYAVISTRTDYKIFEMYEPLTSLARIANDTSRCPPLIPV